MTFLDNWQSKLPLAYAEFARLVTTTPQVDAGPGLIGAATLWPIHSAIQEFDGAALDAVRDICGPEAKHIFKAVQNWSDDPLTATRDLTVQTKANQVLVEALNKLIQHFQAIGPFAEALAQALVEKQGQGDVYNIAGQIKAAMVNVGGVTNIQALTIQLNLSDPISPAKPKIPHLPFEPETILIPAGEFLMGSDDGPPPERPGHTVTLPSYRIGKYPVTNAQYAAFIQQQGCLAAPEMGWVGSQPPADKLNHPVAGVTWPEAIAYCHWLSEQTGRNYTLPSEAQWEKAARGEDGRRYPWGNDWESERCHHGSEQTAPVDVCPPQSIYGCYDLVGNVREWTRSRWGVTGREPDPPFRYPWHDDNRTDSNTSNFVYRVYRGGAAADRPDQLRCSARHGYVPDKPGPPFKRHGFRVIQLI